MLLMQLVLWIQLRIFIEEDITEEQISKLRSELSKIQGVKSVTFLSNNEEAYKFGYESSRENNALFGFDPEIFSTSFIIEVNNEKNVENIEKEIKGLKAVKGVSSNTETKELAKKILVTEKFFKYYSYSIICLLVVEIIKTIISICVPYKVYNMEKNKQ